MSKINPGAGDDGDTSDSDSSLDLTCREPPLEGGQDSSSPEAAAPAHSAPSAEKRKPDAILCCQGCGCYGMASEFFNDTACGETCHEQITVKQREMFKKERELVVQKQRREARKKEVNSGGYGALHCDEILMVWGKISTSIWKQFWI